MTWITHYSTKKELRQAIKRDPHGVLVSNPSFFDPFEGPLDTAMLTRASITLTNHTKRSWFARVWRRADGKLAVE